MTALRLPWMACGHAARSIISKRSMYTSAPCWESCPGVASASWRLTTLPTPFGERFTFGWRPICVPVLHGFAIDSELFDDPFEHHVPASVPFTEYYLDAGEH